MPARTRPVNQWITMMSPTGGGQDAGNPDGGFSGCTFLDMSEIEVYGQ